MQSIVSPLFHENKKIILELEEQKEREMMMEEAKNELWRRWRQKKGRKIKEWKDIGTNESLEKKLEKIEKEVEKYKVEVEKESREENLKKKREKEKHWEMMRWIVKFMEENREGWITRRASQLKEKREIQCNQSLISSISPTSSLLQPLHELCSLQHLYILPSL